MLVDYTSASAVRLNVWTAVQAGVHVVVGSSGLTADDYTELDQLARNTGVGVVAAGNFSVMAAILQRAAVLAVAHLDHWEIVDYASAGKPDVPSGTARELADTLAQLRTPEVAVPVSDVVGPREARGVDVAGTQIHSVRLPSFAVSTEIVFGGAGERLIMRHDPGESPEPYVPGTLLAIRKVEVRGCGEDWIPARGVNHMADDTPLTEPSDRTALRCWRTRASVEERLEARAKSDSDEHEHGPRG